MKSFLRAILVLVAVFVLLSIQKYKKAENFQSQGLDPNQNGELKSIDSERVIFSTNSNRLNGINITQDSIYTETNEPVLSYDQSTNTVDIKKMSTETLAPYTSGGSINIESNNDSNTINFPSAVYNLKDLKSNKIELSGDFSANSILNSPDLTLKAENATFDELQVGSAKIFPNDKEFGVEAGTVKIEQGALDENVNVGISSNNVSGNMNFSQI